MSTLPPPFRFPRVLRQLNASPGLALNVLCCTYFTFPARNDHKGPPARVAAVPLEQIDNSECLSRFDHLAASISLLPPHTRASGRVLVLFQVYQS